MPVFKVMGKVEPPWVPISFEFQPKVKYRIAEKDIDLECTIAIEQSDVVVTCDVNRWDGDTLAWVLQYIFDWVSAEVDLFTFAAGIVFAVHFDRAEYPDGSAHQLMGTPSDQAALVTAYKVTSTGDSFRGELRDLLPIVVGNPTLMLALRDLASALRYGNNSLTNCGRAIEGLRKALWGKDEAANAELQLAWERLRNTLRVSKDYLQVITDASRGPRHGSSAYIPGPVRCDVLKRAWIVMNRFLAYRLGGDQPLPAGPYPIL